MHQKPLMMVLLFVANLSGVKKGRQPIHFIESHFSKKTSKELPHAKLPVFHCVELCKLCKRMTHNEYCKGCLSKKHQNIAKTLLKKQQPDCYLISATAECISTIAKKHSQFKSIVFSNFYATLSNLLESLTFYTLEHKNPKFFDEFSKKTIPTLKSLSDHCQKNIALRDAHEKDFLELHTTFTKYLNALQAAQNQNTIVNLEEYRLSHNQTSPATT